MKKRLLFYVLFIQSAVFSLAQSYSNEWINFSSNQQYSSQQYFKIKITREGIYRIPGDSLVKAGIPVKTQKYPNNPVDARSLQVFHRGQEQYIATENVTNGMFSDEGYLEFYGRPNDGWLDARMYVSPSAQTNPYYSLISDTAAYFITWNSSLTNNRLTEENDIAFSSYSTAYNCIKNAFQQFSSWYYDGEHDGVDSSDPEYISGEGFASESFQINGIQESTLSLPTRNVASGALEAATINTVVLGLSNDQNWIGDDHHLSIQVNGHTYLDTTYDGYKMSKINIQNISLSELGVTNTSIKYFTSWPASQPSADRQAISYISLKYPHTFNFQGEPQTSQAFFLNDDPQGKSRLSVTNFPVPGSTVILYDLTNNKKIAVDYTGGVISALIPNSPSYGTGRDCFLTSELNILPAEAIRPVSSDPARYARFIDFRNNQANNDFVIITHKSLMDGAAAYKTYRQSKNQFGVTIADIDELYDQFSYGISKHPLAIRGFAEFILHQWTKKPSYLFLIGKSLIPQNCRLDPSLNARNLVPTMAFPSSDNMLTARIPGLSAIQPAIPTGRLSASNVQQIYDYLNKVRDYENNTVDEWMKHAIHLGGGNTLDQQAGFRAYLNLYRSILEDSLFGGHVTSFYKNVSAPQINQSDSLKKLLESGVSLITFFGHSSPTIFDYSLDDPKNYNVTKGHYSFFIANGCYAGDIHNPGGSSSENYVMIPDKGSIGFLASSYLSTVGPLHNYTTLFYSFLSRQMYGKPVGKIIQATVDSIQKYWYDNVYFKEILFEMTLEGDPAIVINSPDKPDLKVAESDIFFTPANVTTEMSEFTMNIAISNYGKVFRDSFVVEIKRKYGNNADTVVRRVVQPVFYRDTLKVRFPVDILKGPGQNYFDVFLDSPQQIDEVSVRNPGGENNNKATAQLLIKSADLIPAAPIKYAIVPDNKVTLKAITGEIFAPSKTYLMEIDTTDQFNSPLKLATSITQVGGVVSWAPPLTLKDSAVYFWRTSLSGSSRWQESSFTYLPGKKGWSQSQIFQFKNDGYLNVRYNRPDRRMDFVNEIRVFRANTTIEGARPLADQDYIHDFAFYVNNTGIRNGPNTSHGFMIAVYEPRTASFMKSVYDHGGNRGHWNELHPSYQGPYDAFDFDSNNATEQGYVQNFLDSIPNGKYVLVMSVNNASFSSFGPGLLGAFQRLGATKVDSLHQHQIDTASYIFFGKKGVGVPHEVLSKRAGQLLELNDSLVLNWTDGYVTSELIGPAKKWETLKWREHTRDLVNNTDKVTIDIIGVKNDGTEVTLVQSLPKDSSTVSLASRVNAALYPYVKLQAYLKDTTNRTPAALDKWQIYYQGVPEATLNPARAFSFYKDSLQEGDAIKFSCAMENISDADMDSLSVKAWIMDKNRVQHTIYDRKRKPLLASGKAPNDTISFTTAYPTKGFAGANSFWVEINQGNAQPEQYHFNDISNIPFYVRKDNSNPLLDVTFDGVHILDGDIVSAKPSITIRLKDENQYLPLNDTSMFRVWLLPPGASDIEKSRLYFRTRMISPSTLKFTPGVPPKNTAEVEYDPVLSQDGVYTLIVEGVDASKNESGKRNYRVNFEVINRSTITEVLNYPNPFSTSTRFVFTLTGSELPSQFKIQILTVTGKVVREIMLNELGPIHIGRNITEYAWNGKDEFGDQLANGIYIYRVVTTINGSAIEKRETSAKDYFVKGYGKMYLMR